MTLTLLLLIFIFIAFFSALTIILVTVKKGEFSKRPYLQSIIVYILFFTNWILFLCVTSRENQRVPISAYLVFPLYIRFYHFLARMEKQPCVLHMYRFSFLYQFFIWVIVVSSFGDVTVIKRIKILFITVFFVP